MAGAGLRPADGIFTNVTAARRSGLEQQKNAYWVFGYGSLIWRPGFSFTRQVPARLIGAHRRLCVLSYRHRGTEVQPGLVFGLMRGGSCAGMAFEVAAETWPHTHEYLREREMDRGVYLETVRPVRLADGTAVRALAFVVDPHHPQFAGRLSIDEQVKLVRAGVGESGVNTEYVRATARHLKLIGIHDPLLEQVVAALDSAEAGD